jgi:hypothetical protein
LPPIRLRDAGRLRALRYNRALLAAEALQAVRRDLLIHKTIAKLLTSGLNVAVT